MTITTTYDTLTPQIRRLSATLGQGAIKRVLTSVAEEFVRQTHANFSTSNKYKESKFAPYSKSYTKQKGTRSVTLVDTGALRNSIKVGTPRADSIYVYTKNKYAAYHTLGTAKMPKRNFWPAQIFTPSSTWLLYNSERDIIAVISKRLVAFSGGILPQLSTTFTRQPTSTGNIFTTQ